ncbi:MAG: hypothetical protein GPJ52_00795 [Candidatus Heimdallarchaeota archaeon]|nr:hypothetical protein [Candidatus Heimdallarchaeota archaeon]
MGKLTTYQKWMIGFGMIGLLIASIGIYTSIRLSHVFIPDDDPIIIPTHTPTPTNGGTPTPPPYQKPEMLLDSATIIPDIDSAEFQISVSNSEHVMFIAVHFYVDGVEDSYALELNNPISGVFQKTITRTSFSTYNPSSTITIYLIMAYYDEQGIIDTERVDDVITFSFLLEEDLPPYYPPEIIAGTFEYSIEETIITFGFSTTYHELINSIGCYFVIDDDVFEISTGQDYVIEMIHVESGYYQSLFDYTLFPLDIDVFLSLTVGYVDIEGEDDSYIVEELTYFNIPSGTANGVGINYLFIVMATAVVFALFTIIKKTRKRRSD